MAFLQVDEVLSFIQNNSWGALYKHQAIGNCIHLGIVLACRAPLWTCNLAMFDIKTAKFGSYNFETYHGIPICNAAETAPACILWGDVLQLGYVFDIIFRSVFYLHIFWDLFGHWSIHFWQQLHPCPWHRSVASHQWYLKTFGDEFLDQPVGTGVMFQLKIVPNGRDIPDMSLMIPNIWSILGESDDQL